MHSANSHGSVQVVAFDDARTSTEEGKFYRHNRARLLAWLRCYSDYHEPGYCEGVPNFEKMEAHGARSPLNSYRLRRLDDEKVHLCHRILTGAVNELERERWWLYEGLLPVYLGDDPNPTLPYHWSEVTLDSHTARLALAAHHEAVKFMHANVERELSDYRLKRLKVAAPWWPPMAPWPIGFRSVNILKAYYRHLEVANEPTAVRKVAEETGYAAESVRAVVRQAEEGVLTRSLTRHYRAVPKKFDGLRLRKLRRERALSPQDLERTSGVSQRTISALEGGKRDARPRTVKKLAKALGVEPQELMRGDS